jgi:hypothetical protein
VYHPNIPIATLKKEGSPKDQAHGVCGLFWPAPARDDHEPDKVQGRRRNPTPAERPIADSAAYLADFADGRKFSITQTSRSTLILLMATRRPSG